MVFEPNCRQYITQFLKTSKLLSNLAISEVFGIKFAVVARH